MRRLCFILFLLLLIILPKAIYAHGGGSLLFVKIDGEETKTYFLEEASIISQNLIIPQDIAPENYRVGEQIKFEVDVSKLEDTKELEVYWDFGDRSKGTGTSINHTYKKAGSYILRVDIDGYGEKSPIPSETVLINIVPNKEYQLPKAVIKVNDKLGTKENYNILDFDLNNSLEFDGSVSKQGSASINKYSWDFGDDKSDSGKITRHQYELPQAFATVVLRVYDENGFFSDAFINIRNSGKNDPNSLKNINIIELIPIVLVVLGIVAGGYLILKGGKRKK